MRNVLLPVAFAAVVGCSASHDASQSTGEAATFAIDYAAARALFLKSLWGSIGPSAMQTGYLGAPVAGRVNAIAFSPDYDGRGTPAIFAATPSGGVFRGTGFTGTTTWQAVSDSSLAASSAAAIAVDPTNPRTIWLGSGDAFNGGWGAGLVRSTDGGSTWSIVFGGGSNRGISRIFFDPKTADTMVMAGMGSPNHGEVPGLWRSVDHGATWSAWKAGMPDDAAVTDLDYTVGRTNNATYYAATAQSDGTSSIWKSTGGPWSRMRVTGDATQLGNISLGCDHAMGRGDAYAITYVPGGQYQGSVIYSLVGSTWQPTLAQPAVTTQSGWGSALGVSPEGVLYLGGARGEARMSFDGATWYDVTGGTNGARPHADNHGWVFANGSAYAMTDGGVFRFDPATCGPGCVAERPGKWTSLATVGLTNTLVGGADNHPTDPHVFAAGMQDNGFGTGGNSGWRYLGGDDVAGVRFTKDPNVLVVQSNMEGIGRYDIARAQGAGVQPPFGNDEKHPDIVPIDFDRDSGRWIAAGSRLYESTNLGDSWAAISPILRPAQSGESVDKTQIVSVALTIWPSVMYAAAADAIFMTASHGQSWSRVCDGVTGVQALASDPLDATRVYIATWDHVYVAERFGQTCRDLTGDLRTPGIASITVVHRPTSYDPWIFLGGFQGGVMVEPTGGGGHWDAFGVPQLPPGAGVSQLRYNPFTNKLVASTVGRGAYVTDFSLPLTIRAHLQGYRGDSFYGEDDFVGTRGQSRRLDGFQFNFRSAVPGLGMQYMAHLDASDTAWVPAGQFLGTRGETQLLQGFAVRLTGPQADDYDVEYMCHVQDIGDLPFVSNGNYCGTRGQNRRLEGMMVRVVPRNFRVPPIPESLTVSLGGSGRVTSQPLGIDCGTACKADFPYTSQVTLTATPDSGWSFSGWTGACAGSSPVCTVTMDQSKGVSASFAPQAPSKHALSLTLVPEADCAYAQGAVTSTPAGIDCRMSTSTEVSCTGYFDDGAAVSLVAAAGSSTKLNSFTGDCASSSATCNLTMTRDMNVTVTFCGLIP